MTYDPSPTATRAQKLAASKAVGKLLQASRQLADGTIEPETYATIHKNLSAVIAGAGVKLPNVIKP